MRSKYRVSSEQTAQIAFLLWQISVSHERQSELIMNQSCTISTNSGKVKI